MCFRDRITAELLFSFDLSEACDSRRMVVAQVVQNDIRRRLREIELSRNLMSGIYSCRFFIEEHIKTVMNEMELNMKPCFQMYEKVAAHIGFPNVSGKVVVAYYYNDEIRGDIIRFTELNEDYNVNNQLIIERIEDNENSAK